LQVREVCWHDFVDRMGAEGTSVARLAEIHLAFVHTIQRRCLAHSTGAIAAVKRALHTVGVLCEHLTTFTTHDLNPDQVTAEFAASLSRLHIA
jgi:hypothetical protein